jgi:hypothetical protein
MTNSNGYTDIALRDVQEGKKTVEDLEKRADFLAGKSDATSQKMLEGVKAALEILARLPEKGQE